MGAEAVSTHPELTNHSDTPVLNGLSSGTPPREAGGAGAAVGGALDAMGGWYAPVVGGDTTDVPANGSSAAVGAPMPADAAAPESCGLGSA